MRRVKNLQGSLARTGGVILIERSTPAGEHPLKVVTLEQQGEPARATKRQHRPYRSSDSNPTRSAPKASTDGPRLPR